MCVCVCVCVCVCLCEKAVVFHFENSKANDHLDETACSNLKLPLEHNCYISLVASLLEVMTMTYCSQKDADIIKIILQLTDSNIGAKLNVQKILKK